MVKTRKNVKEHTVYPIERVLSKRFNKTKRYWEVLVRWMPTWEPETHV
jgi:hypothetical protein